MFFTRSEWFAVFDGFRILFPGIKCFAFQLLESNCILSKRFKVHMKCIKSEFG